MIIVKKRKPLGLRFLCDSNIDVFVLLVLSGSVYSK